MRVLLVTSEMPGFANEGGIGTYTDASAKALTQVGCQVDVLLCARGVPKQTLNRCGYRLHCRPLLRWAWPLAPLGPRTALRLLAASSVRYWVRRLPESYDVIEFPEWRADGAFLSSRSEARVVHLHTGIAVAARFERSANPLDRRLASALEARAVRNAHRVVAASNLIVDATREELTRLPHVSVVPLAVDIEVERPQVQSSQDLDPPVVLVVGRLVRRKNHLLAIDTMRLLQERGLRGQLVFAGGPTRDRRGRQYLRQLEASASAANVPLTLLGHIGNSEVHQWYSASRVVLVPSVFESFSMVAVEAAAHGRPVVTTTGVGAVEHLRAGIRSVPPTAHCLADAVAPYLDDAGLAELEGRRGFDSVQSVLRPDLIARRRVDAYRLALAARTKSLER